MDTDELKPDKQESNRNSNGTFKEGISGNPKGRPKGKTLKEWRRETLAAMSDEERLNFLKTVSNETQWKMAEGNPPTVIQGDEDKPIIIRVVKEIAEQNEINPDTSDSSS